MAVMFFAYSNMQKGRPNVAHNLFLSVSGTMQDLYAGGFLPNTGGLGFPIPGRPGIEYMN